jgi:hypothetical protein
LGTMSLKLDCNVVTRDVVNNCGVIILIDTTPLIHQIIFIIRIRFVLTFTDKYFLSLMTR